MAKIRATHTDDPATGPIPIETAEYVARGPSDRHGLPNPQIPAQRTAGFDLMAHPQRWDWSDRLNRWWPHLGFFDHSPGAGGVDNKGQLHHAEAHLAARGWVLLNRESPGFPDKWRGYVKKTRIQGGREDEPIYVYHPVWMKPVPGGNRTRWIKDQAMEDAFIQDMLDARIIAPMQDIIVGERTRAQLQRVRKIEEDIYANGGSPALEGRLKRERLRLAKMRGEDEQEAINEVAQVIAVARREGGSHSANGEPQGSLTETVKRLEALVQAQADQLAALTTKTDPEPKGKGWAKDKEAEL